jgi:sulfate permease, SulP family
MTPPLTERAPESGNVVPPSRIRVAAALRHVLRVGYSKDDFRADLLAGLVVGVVALPLSMALAIASGVPPQHGLYTAIVAGGLIAVLGGSRVQVSGPTAAFVVILAPIAARFGIGGLLVATCMAGLMLMAMGLARLGRLIEFIPYPVTAGFTAGIGIVIATLQVKDFLGLQVPHLPEHYLERTAALAAALPSARLGDLGVGAFTLTVLLVWPRITRRLPAPLVALALAGVGAYLLRRFAPGFEVATINDRFSYVSDGATHQGIPRAAPLFVLPWNLAGGNGEPLGLSVELLRTLAPSAFAIAMLGAIESLLSAVVADGMQGTKHDPDAELFAQGAGNVVAPFFGGIAATGAIARTATNLRSGARSPIAAVVHALFVLAAVLALAPALGYLPMAALAALLLLVAWNMSEAKHTLHAIRVSPKSDVIVLLTCLLLTVIFDMVVSVTAGVMLASLLFMRRMAEVAESRLLDEQHPAFPKGLPSGVMFYEIAGPLFFGAAQKAMSALHSIRSETRIVVLDLEAVPVMDATGLVNLDSALQRLHRTGILVILAGVRPQPYRVLENAGWGKEPGKVMLCRTVEEAVERAKQLAALAA